MNKLKITILPVLVYSLISSLPAFAAKPPKDKITMEKAEQIAGTNQAGAIEGKELEFENGKWVYSFDIRGSDKLIHEIQVNSKNGEIVSNTTETPAQEAAEARGD